MPLITRSQSRRASASASGAPLAPIEQAPPKRANATPTNGVLNRIADFVQRGTRAIRNTVREPSASKRSTLDASRPVRPLRQKKHASSPNGKPPVSISTPPGVPAPPMASTSSEDIINASLPPAPPAHEPVVVDLTSSDAQPESSSTSHGRVLRPRKAKAAVGAGFAPARPVKEAPGPSRGKGTKQPATNLVPTNPRTLKTAVKHTQSSARPRKAKKYTIADVPEDAPATSSHPTSGASPSSLQSNHKEHPAQEKNKKTQDTRKAALPLIEEDATAPSTATGVANPPCLAVIAEAFIRDAISSVENNGFPSRSNDSTRAAIASDHSIIDHDAASELNQNYVAVHVDGSIDPSTMTREVLSGAEQRLYAALDGMQDDLAAASDMARRAVGRALLAREDVETVIEDVQEIINDFTKVDGDRVRAFFASREDRGIVSDEEEDRDSEEDEDRDDGKEEEIEETSENDNEDEEVLDIDILRAQYLDELRSRSHAGDSKDEVDQLHDEGDSGVVNSPCRPEASTTTPTSCKRTFADAFEDGPRSTTDDLMLSRPNKRLRRESNAREEPTHESKKRSREDESDAEVAGEGNGNATKRPRCSTAQDVGDATESAPQNRSFPDDGLQAVQSSSFSLSLRSSPPALRRSTAIQPRSPYRGNDQTPYLPRSRALRRVARPLTRQDAFYDESTSSDSRKRRAAEDAARSDWSPTRSPSEDDDPFGVPELGMNASPAPQSLASASASSSLRLDDAPRASSSSSVLSQAGGGSPQVYHPTSAGAEESSILSGDDSPFEDEGSVALGHFGSSPVHSPAPLTRQRQKAFYGLENMPTGCVMPEVGESGEEEEEDSEQEGSSDSFLSSGDILL